MRRISSLSFNQQYYAQNLARIGLGINQEYAAIELSYNKNSPAASISRGVWFSAIWGRLCSRTARWYGSSAAVNAVEVEITFNAATRRRLNKLKN